MFQTHSNHRFVIAVFCVGVVFLVGVLFPYKATAQQPTTYQPETVQDQIMYLLGMIAQLQELLELLKEREAEESSSIRGTGRADVDVDTLSARDIAEDEAELRGEIDFNGEDEARVWFEYGEDDDDLDERTSRRRVTDSRGDELRFSAVISNLDEDERYYFRAVAEDENGDRVYGAIRSFETEDGSANRSGGFELSVSDTSVEVGDDVEVTWEIPSSDEGSRNWIGLYEEGDDNDDYVSWKYIKNDTEGEERFEMEDEGEFEFRLFLNDSYNDEITSQTITVED